MKTTRLWIKINAMTSLTPRRLAALQALFVTLLWSTSWILIKIGLKDIPALTFAGLRYSLAFACLLPFALQAGGRSELRRLTPRQWRLLIALGLVFYTVVQGTQFLALAFLPAATVSLTLNFTAVVVAVMGAVWLNEPPGMRGWGGIILSALGGMVFFYPVQFEGQQGLGLTVAIAGMLANAFSSAFGRKINSREGISPLIVTTVSMGTGGLALLLLGVAVQETPNLEARGIGIIVWLAVVNTAFAFTLWNLTQRTLSAMESTLINGTMTIQIALLAWLFLGEALTPQKIAGMFLVAAGVAVVQMRK